MTKLWEFIKITFILYCGAAIIAWDADPRQWTGFGRFMFIIVILLVAVSVFSTTPYDERRDK